MVTWTTLRLSSVMCLFAQSRHTPQLRLHRRSRHDTCRSTRGPVGTPGSPQSWPRGGICHRRRRLGDGTCASTPRCHALRRRRNRWRWVVSLGDDEILWLQTGSPPVGDDRNGWHTENQEMRNFPKFVPKRTYESVPSYPPYGPDKQPNRSSYQSSGKQLACCYRKNIYYHLRTFKQVNSLASYSIGRIHIHKMLNVWYQIGSFMGKLERKQWYSRYKMLPSVPELR